MSNDTINNFMNTDFSALSDFLTKISPLEFTSLGCLIGLLISSSLNNNEQNSIGNFLELVGQVILTVQAQGSFNTSSPTIDQFNAFKQETKTKLNYLLKEIKKCNK